MTALVVATHDPPPRGVPNPIHNDEGAAASGYAGALVTGVRTYGWTVDSLVGAAGDAWLDEGWVDFTLHRPVFVGDELTIEIGGRELSAATGRGVVLDGTFGVGEAPFLADLRPPPPAPAQEPPDPRPGYGLDDAPIGEPLRPLSAHVSAGAACRLATDNLGIGLDRWDRVVHPYFLAARMAPLTRHNFTYGPTIHVRTQIQHRGRVGVDQTLTIGARIIEVYERKGHWYQVLDGVITAGPEGQIGTEVARLRHHTIFRPRAAG